MTSRRDFLKACLATQLLAATPALTLANARAPLTLTASKTNKRLVPGDEYKDASVWAFNQTVPGPELRLKKGDTLSVDFLNQLDEGSSIHWHGIRNINAMDGVAGLTQPEVMPDGQFRYEFRLNDSGTYWYHSHAKTWSQVARGLYGPLIVEDESDPAVDHDLVLMIDDWLLANDGTIEETSFGSLHDWAHGGRLGNWLTVNGESLPTIEVAKNSRIRLRLINAANARIFGLNIPASAFLIAEDGYSVPVQKSQDIVLAPAQRADFIVDLGDTDLTIAETLNGEKPYPAAIFKVVESNKPLVAKDVLKQPLLEAPPQSIDVSIPLHMQGGAMGNLSEATYNGQLRPIRELAQTYKKAWAFNGAISEHHDHLAKISIGQTVSIEVWNDTRWNHAMHLHGHHFWIQKEDGAFLDGKRDTYLFQRGEKANLVFVADNPGLWLFHCHMLEHHAAGMGAVIEIS
jgi:FtsP/CotA-like multicopper oxidase with cupredoxin domain